MDVRNGIIGTLAALLLLGGGVVLLNQEEQSHTYYCNATDEVGVFHGDGSGYGDGSGDG